VKLLVTGGAGYLGSEVCRQAVERGFEVLAGRHRLPPPYGRPVRLEIRDEHATARVLMRHGPEAVVHTAYRQEAEELADTVVRGSRSVALAAARSDSRRSGSRLCPSVSSPSTPGLSCARAIRGSSSLR